MWRETARRFLQAEAPIGHARSLIGDETGYDRNLYRRMAALGWTAPLAPEPAGGGSVSGAPFDDLAAVIEEIGGHLTPGPLLEANLAALALGRIAGAAHRGLLEGLVSGQTTATVALAAPADDGWNANAFGLIAEPSPHGAWRLSGARDVVAFGASVDILLTSARSPDGRLQLVVVPVDRPGVRAARLQSFDLTRPLVRLEFVGAEVPAESGLYIADPSILEAALAAGVVLQAAETVGALSRVFEMSVAYAQDRRAFGRAIGSFQAVKHRLADMALWLEWARAAADLAVKAADEWWAGEPADRLLEAASVAKSVLGEFGPLMVRSAVQVHGGIGYTWEHDCHLYLRRVEANAALWGTTDFHRDRLAVRLGLPESVPA